MSHAVVVKSFADLPRLLSLDDLPPGPAEVSDESPAEAVILDSPVEPDDGAASIDLADLLAELEAASATLAVVARQDEESRALAIRDLERYDAVAATLGQAEQVCKQAGELHSR